MRKHRPLLWRKSNPRSYRFPIPNSIWEYKLRPKAFTVLCYLVYRSSGDDGVPPTVEQIASGVHMSRSVVKKNLDTLRSANLVSEDGALTDMVRDLSAGFFSLPNEVFLLPLSPGALSVYAYLLCCKDRRTHQCHPSYKTICAHTGMAVSTAEKYVAELTEAGLISVEPSGYFRHGLKRNGNNTYTILPVRKAVEAHYQRQLRQGERDRRVRRQLQNQRPRPTA